MTYNDILIKNLFVKRKHLTSVSFSVMIGKVSDKRNRQVRLKTVGGRDE